MATKVTEDYVEVIRPEGYVSNREVTNLPGHFLVKGSKNTKIINKEKVVTGPRFIPFGQAGSVLNPPKSSVEWATNTGVERALRVYKDGQLCEFELWVNNAWERVVRRYTNPKFNFGLYWLANELLDVLLMVNNNNKIMMWSGGRAEVASVTANTITKKGYFQGTNISFDAATRKINRTTGNWTVAGFQPGDVIVVSGSANNNGEYTIATVTANDITLISSDVLVNEAIGPSVTVKWLKGGTWGEERFLVAQTGRAVRIGGVDFTYTGGEGTGTLTGVSPNPVAAGVANGDIAYQTIMEFTPGVFTNYKADLIGVYNNHAYIGSKTSRTLYISKNTAFNDFGFTTPLRKPGEGFSVTLDACPNAILATEDGVYISAGDDDWYKVDMILSQDQGGETVVITKLKTAPKQATYTQDTTERIKNAVVFLSKERTIDTLGNIESIPTRENRSISDDIRDDIEAYDFTDAHMKYYRRSLFIALPREGILLEYDMRFGYWQPPQEMPVGRLAIIEDKLVAHSNHKNESYQLLTGYNDLGAPFTAIALFGYDNFGTRFGLKNFDETAVELYLSKNTKIQHTIYYDYKGATGIRTFEIDGADPAITFEPAVTIGFGQSPYGNNPFASSPYPVPDLVKCRAINTTAALDFFERQREFKASGKDIRFEIIAFGENASTSDNEPNFIRR